MIKIAITGAGGRMGRRIAALALESGQYEIVAATEASGHEVIGRDVGELAGAGAIGVKVADGLGQARPEVMIDFSLPEGTMKCLDASVSGGTAMVIGTTGMTQAQQERVAQAAERIAIVQGANMSAGVNVLLKAAAQVARALGSDYDIEITETHHRFKKDAPSGTALALARGICEALGKDPAKTLRHGRQGLSERKSGEIGMHALRVGDTVGEHSVVLGNLGETITLSHSAHTRDTFARGALRAAQWLARPRPKGAGLYSMADVLGL